MMSSRGCILPSGEDAITVGQCEFFFLESYVFSCIIVVILLSVCFCKSWRGVVFDVLMTCCFCFWCECVSRRDVGGTLLYIMMRHECAS
jgi:hypothetical protein